MHRIALRVVFLLAVPFSACQSPTDPSDAINYDDVVVSTVAPNPVVADAQTGGRTYRVVRGNNQPDEILAYDWHAVFSMTVAFNNDALDSDIDVDFPVRLSSTTLAVKQASGGIVTPPTGTDTEKYEFVTLNASGNQFPAIDSPVSLTFEVWYDLPSLRKEAVVSVSFSFVGDDGAAFSKVVDVNVAP